MRELNIAFPMMKNRASRLLPTNIPTIIQQRETVMFAEIMNMCGLERCHCLQAFDLVTGEVIPLVSHTHKSSDFIGFLKILDAKYPEGDTIRLILDNHSAHTSRETRQFLTTLPEGRFVFVFKPTHTSWLNMMESFFSKMTKQMLKGIRVNSKKSMLIRSSIIGHIKWMKLILMK